MEAHAHSSPFYKPGQGFWVRCMTAALAGLLITAGTGWLWQQLGIVGLPTPTWKMVVRDADFTPAIGQNVDLLTRGPAEGEFVKIGQASAREWEATTSKGQHFLVVGSLAFEGTHTPDQIEAVRDPAKPEVSAKVEGKATGIPIVNRDILRAIGAGIFLIAGGIAIFWTVGRKPSTVDFLIATDAEMKKVNWSTRREVVGSTQVVIMAFFLIAAVIFAIDTVFQTFFRVIEVIRL